MTQRLGSLFRVEYKDGRYSALAYIVAGDIKEAKKIFLASHMWVGKPIIAISMAADNVYGGRDDTKRPVE